ncbi:MAG: hypothetical protein WCK59_04005 [Candidatus Falkowbacteria bacterium]
MKTKKIFFLLAVVMLTLFLTACQKVILVDNYQTSGLFLKSAKVGEMTSNLYFNQASGKMEKIIYPNDLLFEVSKAQEAKILNNINLVVKDFYINGAKSANFYVSEIGSKPITASDLNIETVEAQKIPFTTSDFTLQAEGLNRFNGLLKTATEVLAIKSGNIRIYNLTTGETISSSGTVLDDTLSFKVGAESWALKFVKSSPVGNLFELSVSGATTSCYTIAN